MKFLYSISSLIIILYLFNISNSSNLLSSIISKVNSPFYSNSFDFSFNNDLPIEELEKEEAESLRGKLFIILRDVIESKNISKANISNSCKNVLNKYLLGQLDQNNLTNISYIVSDYNIVKLLDDSSKNRNNLGTYDKCMQKLYKMKGLLTRRIKAYNDPDKILSTYVVLTAESLKSNNTKDDDVNEILELDNFLIVHGFCLPQGYDLNNEYCTDEDYKNLLIYANDSFNDIFQFKDTNIDIFTLRNKPLESEDFTSWVIFLNILPLIYFGLQAIFIIFSSIYLYCHNKKKTEIISENKKIIEDNEDDNKGLINNTKQKNSYQILYDIMHCFSFVENAKELFSFSLNATKFNNDSGLNYIRGLIGLSILFTAFGFTFIVLYNSPSKVSSSGHILEFFYDNWFLNIIVEIGIRYSPRIILSCSGYLLAYKFISYLDKNIIQETDSVIILSIKFIFYQFHKYFLLIMLLLSERFSVYHLFKLFYEYINPIFKFLYVYRLQRPGIKKFLLSFTLLGHYFYKTDEEQNLNGSNLLQYLWMPFNEIFFFLIGVCIISTGFKMKWRIDYFILCFVPVLYIAKIIYSYVTRNYYEDGRFPLHDCYPTLYYVFFNYGRDMINPLFNLPYYLIGIYFGLINYTIQKGIIDIYKTNNEQLFISKNEYSNLFTKKGEEGEMDKSNSSFDDQSAPEIEGNANNLSNDKKEEYCEEIKQMPFLITPTKMVQWHRKQSNNILIILCIIFIILFLFFVYIILIFGKYYINAKGGEEYFKEAFVNPFVNFIYRIDIELVIIFVQWFSFIIMIKMNDLAFEFFNNVFWIVLSRPYFSYILVVNTLLLFLFYHEETLTDINSISVLMFTLIGGGFTFLFLSIFYILYELPLKRVIRLFFKNDIDEKDKDNEEINEKENEESENDNEEEFIDQGDKTKNE